MSDATPLGEGVYDKPIRCAARDSNTPGGGVRNANGGSSREGDREKEQVAGLWRAKGVSSVPSPITVRESPQVSGEVFRAPVLDDDRKDRQDRYREQIVVEHSIPIRKPGGFDSFAHRQHLHKHRIRGGTGTTTNGDHIRRQHW